MLFSSVSQSILINKSAKRQIKSSNAGGRAAARSPSRPNTGIYQANPPHVTREIVRTPSAHRNSPHQTGERTELEMKKEQEKKDANGHKPRESEVGKVTKGKVEGKHNAGARRSGSGTIRKDMKDIGIGTVSGMRRLAVGVAS